MSVLNQLQGGKHRYRDSYGRFAADSKSGDNTSLGWNDFMPVTEFLDPELGYTVDDTAVFSASFHIIKESTTFTRNLDRSSSVLKRSKSKVRRAKTYNHWCQLPHQYKLSDAPVDDRISRTLSACTQRAHQTEPPTMPWTCRVGGRVMATLGGLCGALRTSRG